MPNILTFLLLDGINQFPMCFMRQKSAPEKEDSSREAEEFHGEARISQTGCHFAMYDDQQNYFKALLSFLKA